MSCPLCNEQKNITIRKYQVSELRMSWKETFGFDPFPKSIAIDTINKKQCASCKLIYFDPPSFGDKNFYSLLSKNSWYYEENKWEYDVAAEFIANAAPNNLLEIGCGQGFFLDKISSLAVSACGVDINEDAIQSARAKGLNVKSSSVYDLESSYDMVVMFEVLEHLDDPKKLFDFFTTSLIADGGHLIIAVPNPNGYLKNMETNLLDMPPHHNTSWSEDTFISLAKSYGLQLVDYKKEPLRYVHYLGMNLNTLNEYAKLTPATLRHKTFLKIQRFIVQMLSPLTFAHNKNLVDGQTHIVVFRNVR